MQSFAKPRIRRASEGEAKNSGEKPGMTASVPARQPHIFVPRRIPYNTIVTGGTDMFVFSVKTSRRQLWIGLICLAALVIVLAAAFLWPAGAVKQTGAAAADREGQIAYLRSLGWEVDANWCEVREVLIPDEFDDVFAAYNELQKAAGMDLAPYHGRRLKCWSWRVLNGEEETLAHLYVQGDRVVGGDVTPTLAGSKAAPLTARR